MTTSDASKTTPHRTDDERVQVAVLRWRSGVRTGVVVLALFVVAMTIFFVVARSKASKPMSITYLVLVLGMFLFVVVVGALALAWSRRQLQPGSGQVLLASEPDRAKDVLVRLAKGRPVRLSNSAFVTAHLRTTRQTRILGLILGMLGVALLVLGVVMLVQRGPLWGTSVATIVAALLMTVLGVGLCRQHARLRRNAAAQGFPLP